MDAFVTRKKRKSNAEDNEPTEVKLAILASLHPAVHHDTLLDVLIAHDGDVDATLRTLGAKPPPRKAGGGGTPPFQASLRSFAVALPGPGPRPGAPKDMPSPTKRAKVLSRKGTTLHLYDPMDISEHTPCTIIHNFLPLAEADALLRELLDESKTFTKATFKLFDNVVSSPHTSALYVSSHPELQEQKHEYVYNGSRMTDVRTLTPHLERVKHHVQEAVNREIQERIRTRYGGTKLKYQDPEPWAPNAAFVNCYDGPQENVGWHSDQLTYLGPRPVIGSLSLGVTREFRVRRIVPSDDAPGDQPDPDPGPGCSAAATATAAAAAEAGEGGGKGGPDRGDLAGQIAIHLPHNSLLVMHADMQEAWKHSVSPARAVDPHPVAGRRRINVTYRYYRPSFHPRGTPRCPCGVPAVLRVANRTRRNEADGPRYFWMCHAGNVPGKEACKFFRWAELDEDGNPVDYKRHNTA
ncbi:hypothetical protein VTJ83DRAFT_4918 [Remersonia thermophila]|uniref:Fe2OG dioxygenase domain-containing protein n=1 Tax=Remersonia thermophila TaxID=72144 RepID=A0ABR4DBB6_9PEZI